MSFLFFKVCWKKNKFWCASTYMIIVMYSKNSYFVYMYVYDVCTADNAAR